MLMTHPEILHRLVRTGVLGNWLPAELLEAVSERLRTLAPPPYGEVAGGLVRLIDEGVEWLRGGKKAAYYAKLKQAVHEFAEGDIDAAIGHVERAKWDIDEWALAHYFLGLLLVAKDDLPAALRELRRANDLEPYDKAAIREAIGQVEDALRQQ
jgi:tetratricopeptide (TPR) repeat protein